MSMKTPIIKNTWKMRTGQVCHVSRKTLCPGTEGQTSEVLFLNRSHAESWDVGEGISDKESSEFSLEGRGSHPIF